MLNSLLHSIASLFTTDYSLISVSFWAEATNVLIGESFMMPCISASNLPEGSYIQLEFTPQSGGEPQQIAKYSVSLSASLLDIMTMMICCNR